MKKVALVTGITGQDGVFFASEISPLLQMFFLTFGWGILMPCRSPKWIMLNPILSFDCSALEIVVNDNDVRGDR